MFSGSVPFYIPVSTGTLTQHEKQKQKSAAFKQLCSSQKVELKATVFKMEIIIIIINRHTLTKLLLLLPTNETRAI